MATCTLYTNDHTAKQILYYGYLKGKHISNAEVLSAKWIASSKSIDYDDVYGQIKNNTSLYILGEGTHIIEVNDIKYTLNVSSLMTDGKFVFNHNYNDFIKKVTVTINNSTLTFKESLDLLIESSQKEWKELVCKFESTKKSVIKKFVYDKDGFWDFMSTTEYRKRESIFLPKGKKDEILNYVENFVKPETKADYLKFNIPYKCNFLLYGVPGSGKTSTCLAVASHLKTNIGLIPLTRSIDDSALIHAINNVKNKECKVIVIEDIDCLFHDRKANDTLKNALTLSGLLNCMDGLYRDEGVIVFLTTNTIDVLDKALTRSSRIDMRIKYDYADEYQTFECFKYFFPKNINNFESFYDMIKHKNYTIANLQEFFFKHKDSSGSLAKHIKEFNELITFNEQIKQENEQSNLYI